MRQISISVAGDDGGTVKVTCERDAGEATEKKNAAGGSGFSRVEVFTTVMHVTAGISRGRSK